MLALQRRQETLANNIANINTPGFKADEGVMRAFPEQLIARIRDKQGPQINGYPNPAAEAVVIGRLHTGVYVPEAISNFRQGDIQQTDNPLHVALLDNLPPVELDGEQVERRLFFGVARLEDPEVPAEPEAIRYTRNGQWQVNAQGYLVTPDGYYVLDHENRAIRLDDPENFIMQSRDFRMSETGELFVQDPNSEEGAYLPLNGVADARIGLKVVTNPNQLVREGTNIYRWEGEGQPANVEEVPDLTGFYGVKQGWVERSNVDATQTMTDMMTVLRAYEANQRVITTLDGTMEKAVTEIGRING